MFAFVPGVRAAPPAMGLVASAQRPETTDTRWVGGMAWVPEQCGAGYQLLPWCTTGDPDEHTPDSPGDVVYYRPPTARWAVTCSVMGGGVDSERARRLAEATTPWVVARELWSGDLAQDDAGFDVPGGGAATNPYLASADATVVGSGGADPLTALGDLEAAALEASMGQRVMLHIPPALVPVLATAVRRVGNLLLTHLDNVVVADAAYPGTGPAGQEPGATVWAYATAMVQVRLAPLVVHDDPAQITDRRINSATVWATRAFAATFDPCVHLATEITRE